MLTSESRISDIGGTTSTSIYFGMEIGICDYEFHCGAALDTQGISPVWVIVFRITKFVHILLVNSSCDAYRLATVYIDKIARLHGILVSIVLDGDPKMCLNSGKPSRGDENWIVSQRYLTSVN